MNKCSTGCPDQGTHATWGECMRAKNTRVAWAASASGLDRTAEKKWDAELQLYRDARAEGIQPAGTTTEKINQARELSDLTGKPFDAANPLASITKDD